MTASDQSPSRKAGAAMAANEPEPGLPSAYEPRSQQWRWKEHWSGEIGTYRMGRFSARVRDCDGDFSVFEVKVGDAVVAEGAFSDADHWSHAIFAVEQKLVELGALAAESGAARER